MTAEDTVNATRIMLHSMYTPANNAVCLFLLLHATVEKQVLI